LAYVLANPCLGGEPKARVATSFLTQHVSSSTGSETSPFSSSSSPPITPSLSFGDSSAPGNPSRSGASKTANAYYFLGWKSSNNGRRRRWRQ
jgi:hypothetical protein